MPRSPTSTFSRKPPHCPNPDCDSQAQPHTWRFKKKGFYTRRARPQRIQRYVCQTCGRHFSSQTFSPTYWLRLPHLLVPLFYRSQACSGLRQMTYELGVSHTTVVRLLARLGRHCLLFHERLRPRAPREPLVLDGFQTLESGHYWPFDLNLLVGVSHFVYGLSDAELRRSGSMRPGQRRHRERLEARYGRPHPQATRHAVRELLARCIPPGHPTQLHSDEHTAYPRALRDLPDRLVTHLTTSSKQRRTPTNPLFPVNLADLLLRHGGANHKRQTIAFSKRRQNGCYRGAVWMVWRNYVKRVSENRKLPPPGVMLGVIAEPLTVHEILRERLFPWREAIGGWVERCYFGRIATRCIPNGVRHALSYAV